MYHYSIREFGTARAEQYIRDLDKSFYQLAKAPALGRKYDHVRSGLLAFNVVYHIVFFRLSTDGILILRVLHKFMDFNRHLI
ncbi:MAG: type II toxin-antitoxin system RelE/ParE family toxin [Alteromonadaceae bacterium]|nr:type II toxin-antitoxin system RelE/ParE family toxin [Alteromonadaceae bacterium]